MVTVDGSFGYGQVLRTAISLSALTKTPVKIINIRKNRPKSGLMPQHLIGVKTAGEFCRAEVKGLLPGSMEVEFVPKEFDFVDKKIDIATAGSIPLLLQTLFPILIFADKKIRLEILGGTAGLGSPTIEYLQFVTFPILLKIGIPVPRIDVARQGFYPKGQGFVKATINPVMQINPIILKERGEVKQIRGISIAGSLPKGIAARQAYSAKKIILDHKNIDTEVFILDNLYTASSGTSITLWATCENTILGSDTIGEIGKPVEKVGEEAAKDLLKSIDANTALDKHMADQIIPFLALAKGKSEITVEEFTEHMLTNIRVCEQILGVNFDLNREEKKISVEGIGFKI